MKNIYLILGVFTMLFSACETDFDVNAEWEETTVVFGLLDAGEGKETQKIKISKAFLGNMDAYQMAQYADSINFDTANIDVMIIKSGFSEIEDTVPLNAVPTSRDGDIFNDNIVVYEFENENSFLERDYDYELVIINTKTGNVVSSKTEVVSDFKFDMFNSFEFGFIANFVNPPIVEFSSSSVKWKDGTVNGEIFQLDLIFYYTENNIEKSLVFSQALVDEKVKNIRIEGDLFFNFLKTNIAKDNSKIRSFNRIDIVMVVGSEDLETYINVNKPITGIVQQRPQFTNITNGVGLFSSRLSNIISGVPLTSNSIKYLKSVDGLDRNFQ